VFSLEDNKLGERMSAAETKLVHHDKRIEKVEDSTAILGRMELLLEQQMLINKEQNTTLAKINDNLDNLNASQVQMQEEMKTMNSRIQKVEKVQEEEKEKNTLDLSGVLKKSIIWIIGVGLTALSTYILIKLNLK